MATRNREKKPDFEIARKIYRASCPRHVLCLEANMSEKQKRAVFRISKKLCRAGNDLTAILKKNYEQLYRTREYRRLLREYHAVSEKLQNVNKGTPLYKERETELKHISAKLCEDRNITHARRNKHLIKGLVNALTDGKNIILRNIRQIRNSDTA